MSGVRMREDRGPCGAAQGVPRGRIVSTGAPGRAHFSPCHLSALAGVSRFQHPAGTAAPPNPSLQRTRLRSPLNSISLGHNVKNERRALMKRLVRSMASRFGFDIRRKVKADSNLYNSFPEESLLKKRFYNIGAGLFKYIYWTNLDYPTEHYRESQQHSFLNYDLMALDPLPIENDVAELVYSSHTIEHVSNEAVLNMLRESYRILKPGGGIRLTTPDAWLEFQAYRRNDIKYWYWVDWYSSPGTWEKLYTLPLSKASIHQLFLHHFASQLCEIDIDGSPQRKYSDSEISEFFSANPDVQALDYFTKQCEFNPEHPGNHINWWTRGKVISFLKEAGFLEPYVSGWGQSLFPPLRDTSLFDGTHPRISLYVEAIK